MVVAVEIGAEMSEKIEGFKWMFLKASTLS
jgi:hypothetical protein